MFGVLYIDVIKLLLYVVEDIQIALESLSINANDYDNMHKYFFKKLLRQGPVEKLRKLNKNNWFFFNTVQEGKFIKHVFETLQKAFSKLYCTSKDPKEDVVKFLRSEKCMKPKDRSTSYH